jgi:hypothetical protein
MPDKCPKYGNGPREDADHEDPLHPTPDEQQNVTPSSDVGCDRPDPNVVKNRCGKVAVFECDDREIFSKKFERADRNVTRFACLLNERERFTIGHFACSKMKR